MQETDPIKNLREKADRLLSNNRQESIDALRNKADKLLKKKDEEPQEQNSQDSFDSLYNASSVTLESLIKQYSSTRDEGMREELERRIQEESLQLQRRNTSPWDNNLKKVDQWSLVNSKMDKDEVIALGQRRAEESGLDAKTYNRLQLSDAADRYLPDNLKEEYAIEQEISQRRRNIDKDLKAITDGARNPDGSIPDSKQLEELTASIRRERENEIKSLESKLITLRDQDRQARVKRIVELQDQLKDLPDGTDKEVIQNEISALVAQEQTVFQDPETAVRKLIREGEIVPEEGKNPKQLLEEYYLGLLEQRTLIGEQIGLGKEALQSGKDLILGLIGEGINAVTQRGNPFEGQENDVATAQKFTAIDNKIEALTPVVLLNRYGDYSPRTGWKGFVESTAKSFNRFWGGDVTGLFGADQDFDGAEAGMSVVNTLGDLGLLEKANGVLDVAEASRWNAEKGRYESPDFWTVETGGDLLGMVGAMALQARTGAGISDKMLKSFRWGRNFIRLGEKGSTATRFINANSAIGKLAKNPLWATIIDQSVMRGARAARTGIHYEVSGEIFKSNEEEFNFMSGLLGSAGRGLAQGMGQQAMKYGAPLMTGLFKKGTPEAIRVIAKYGKALGKNASYGVGETFEETSQELYQIFRRSNGDFLKQLEYQFGDLSEAGKFAISTFVMGAAFGMGKLGQTFRTHNYQEALKNISTDEERKAVEGIVVNLNKQIEESVMDSMETDYDTKKLPSYTKDGQTITRDEALDLINKGDINGLTIKNDQKLESEHIAKANEQRQKSTNAETTQVSNTDGQSTEDGGGAKQRVGKEGKGVGKTVDKTNKLIDEIATPVSSKEGLIALSLGLESSRYRDIVKTGADMNKALNGTAGVEMQLSFVGSETELKQIIESQGDEIPEGKSTPRALVYTNDQGKRSVVVDISRAKGNTVFHEFYHPILDIIQATDRKAYNSLVNIAKNKILLNTKKGAITFQEWSEKLYEEKGADIQENEALTEWLATVAASKAFKGKNLRAIKNFFKSVGRAFGANIDDKVFVDLAKNPELVAEKLTTALGNGRGLNIKDVKTPENKKGVDYQAMQVFHGSPYEFSEYSADNIGENNQLGWGVYFTNKEDRAKWYAELNNDGKRNIYKSTLEDDNFIEYYEDMPVELANAVANQLSSGLRAKWRAKRYAKQTVGETYRELEAKFGQQRASYIFHKAGLDGFKDTTKKGVVYNAFPFKNIPINEQYNYDNIKYQRGDDFDTWKGDAKEYVGADIQNVETGEPVVLEVYHGTTHNIEEFDAEKYGNTGGHLGKVNYFTSDYQDASMNYLGSGPDLTQRINELADSIENEVLEYEMPGGEWDWEGLGERFGVDPKEINEEDGMSVAQSIAMLELMGDNEQVIEAYVKLNNPLVLDNGKYAFVNNFDEIDESTMDEAAQIVAEENGIDIDEAKEDYQWDVQYMARELEGSESKVVDALNEAIYKNTGSYEYNAVSEILEDSSFEDEVELNQLDKHLRDKLPYYDEWVMNTGQIIADFYRNLGFDGVILTGVSRRFPGMNLGGETSHVHVFNDVTGQIKNTQNETFDDQDNRINYQATETEEFKRWFKNSKIVDKNGEPMVVFHATKNDFEEFESSSGDGLTFFTTNIGFANDWINREKNRKSSPQETLRNMGTTATDQGEIDARDDISRRYKKFNKKWEGKEEFTDKDWEEYERERRVFTNEINNLMSNIMPVYLSIQNPFDARIDEQWEQIKPVLNEQWEDVDRAVVNSGNRTNYLFLENRDVIERLKELGYDGIFISEKSAKDAPVETIAPFWNTQIKSATGNRGTFDSNNPNINYQATETEEFKRWFNQSKIKYPSGKPVVLYHSTGYDIDQFFPSGGLIYTAFNADYADHFGVGRKSIYPLFVKSQKPLDLRDMGLRRMSTDEFIDALPLLDGTKMLMKQMFVSDLSAPAWVHVRGNSHDLSDVLRASGYDGILQYEEAYGERGEVLAVFSPSQVKSAIGNQGTFDPRDNRIAYQRDDEDAQPRESGDLRVSQRVPSAVWSPDKPGQGRLIEDPHGTSDLGVNMRVAKRHIPSYVKNAKNVLGYDMIKPLLNKKDVDKVLSVLDGNQNKQKDEFFVDGVEAADNIYSTLHKAIKDNLIWLYNQFGDDIRQMARRWYDGANRAAKDLSKTYDITVAQAAGVIASMSPQKDWFMNLAVAERVISIFKLQDEVFDDVMLEWADQKYEDAKATAKKDFEKGKRASAAVPEADATNKIVHNIAGKKLSELNPQEAAIFIRAWDESYNPIEYYNYTPSGNRLGFVRNKDGSIAKAAWGSYSEISSAVAILFDGSLENISFQVGTMHKVRNFYNNIVDPNSVEEDVTMDTHAIAAATLLPLSGNSAEVSQNFGSSKKGSDLRYSDNSKFGNNAIYALFADAYRDAASDLGLLPRELQSITWEVVRGLFEAKFKLDSKNVSDIRKIWSKFNGKNVDEIRNEIKKRAGGISEPIWWTDRAYTEDVASGKRTPDERELFSDVLRTGQRTVGNSSRGRNEHPKGDQVRESVAPPKYQMDDGEPDFILNRTARRIANEPNPDLTELRADILLNPTKYGINRFSINDATRTLEEMTEKEREAVFKKGMSWSYVVTHRISVDNMPILAGIMLMDDYARAGNEEEAMRIFNDLWKMGSHAGLMLRFMRELKGTNAQSIVFMVMTQLGKLGLNPPSDAQRKRLETLAANWDRDKRNYNYIQGEINRLTEGDVLKDGEVLDKLLKEAEDAFVKLEQTKVELDRHINFMLPMGIRRVYNQILQGNLLTMSSIAVNIFANIWYNSVIIRPFMEFVSDVAEWATADKSYRMRRYRDGQYFYLNVKGGAQAVDFDTWWKNKELWNERDKAQYKKLKKQSASQAIKAMLENRFLFSHVGKETLNEYIKRVAGNKYITHINALLNSNDANKVEKAKEMLAKYDTEISDHKLGLIRDQADRIRMFRFKANGVNKFPFTMTILKEAFKAPFTGTGKGIQATFDGSLVGNIFERIGKKVDKKGKLRNSKLSKFFGMDNKRGYSDYTALERYDIQRRLAPIQALQQLHNDIVYNIQVKSGRKVTREKQLPISPDGNTPLWLWAEKVTEGIEGLSADSMFRLLSLGDVPFRYMAEAVAARRIALQHGVQNDKEFKAMLRGLSKPEKAIIRRAGDAATFADERLLSSAATFVFGKIAQSLDHLDRRGHKTVATIAGVLIKALVPFVRIPANLMQTVFELALPAIPAAGVVYYAKKDIRKSGEHMSKLALSAAMYTMAGWLYEMGALVGEPRDDKNEKRKNSKYTNGPNTINLSLLWRAWAGVDVGHLPDDKRIEFHKAGILGMFMAYYTRLREDIDDNGDRYGFNMDSILQTPFAAIKSVMPQSFLANAFTAMNTFMTGDASGFLDWFVTLSKTVIPNNFTAIRRSQREDVLTSQDRNALAKFDKKMTLSIMADPEKGLLSGHRIYPIVDDMGLDVSMTQEGTISWFEHLLSPARIKTWDANTAMLRAEQANITRKSMQGGGIPMFDQYGSNNGLNRLEIMHETLKDADGNYTKVNLKLSEGDVYYRSKIAGTLNRAILIQELVGEDGELIPEYQELSLTEKVEVWKKVRSAAASAATQIMKYKLYNGIEEGMVDVDQRSETYEWLEEPTHVVQMNNEEWDAFGNDVEAIIKRVEKTVEEPLK